MTRIVALLLGILFSHAAVLCAQETVTIPKSRLEELERKEAELEKLKGSASQPQSTVQISGEKRSNNAVSEEKPSETPAPAVPAANTAPASIASLPAVEKTTVVSATDLAAHYRADSAAADARYRKHTFRVEGEIVDFEKPPLIRNYHILLKTPEPRIRVICDFYPAENFKSVYTINAGTELVGILPATRVPIAKVGERVIIEGRCKGLGGGGVKLTDCELKHAE